VKIKGLEVRVSWIGGLSSGCVRGKIFPAHPAAAFQQAESAQAVLGLEEPVRSATRRALRSAHRRKAAGLVLDAAAPDAAVAFPKQAAAKIVAQEIYRYVNEVPAWQRRLKRVTVAVADKKDAGFFEKTIFGYLGHVSAVLGSGPFVTVDAIIRMRGGVVLVKRSNPPFGWALPGGFVDRGESLEEAARREVREETGLAVKDLKQFHTYSRPDRDPRFHTVTTVFTAGASGRLRAASDAADARVFLPSAWRALPIAFDHRSILADFLKRFPRKK